jgi:hypothetical protein
VGARELLVASESTVRGGGVCGFHREISAAWWRCERGKREERRGGVWGLYRRPNLARGLGFWWRRRSGGTDSEFAPGGPWAVLATGPKGSPRPFPLFLFFFFLFCSLFYFVTSPKPIKIHSNQGRKFYKIPYSLLKQ